MSRSQTVGWHLSTECYIVMSVFYSIPVIKYLIRDIDLEREILVHPNVRNMNKLYRAGLPNNDI